MNNEFFGVNGNKKLFKEDILTKGIKKGSRILYTKCIKKKFNKTLTKRDQF